MKTRKEILIDGIIMFSFLALLFGLIFYFGYAVGKVLCI